MQKIKNIIKHSQLLGYMYLSVFKIIISVLKLFVRVNSKQIIFTSYSGRQVSDSPYTIYKQLKADPRFSDFSFFWGVDDVSEFAYIPENEKIKIDTFKFWLVLLESKYWVSNTSIERLVTFNHKKHVYINTWHGIPLKHLGPDEGNLEFLVKNWFSKVEFDLLYCSGVYDKRIFSNIFPNSKNIKILGLPRNDELLNLHGMQDKKNILMKKIGLDPEKPTLMYAPTFREYQNSKNANTFDFPFSSDLVEKVCRKFNFMVRGHYFIEDLSYDGIQDKIIDVSSYPDLNDLFMVTDVLVSDYSSLIFDYALLPNKRIILFMYDIDEYMKQRGFYLDPRDLDISYAVNETKFLNILFDSDVKNEIKKTSLLNKKINEHFDENSAYLKKFILERVNK
ncbi:CDP-glycerol--glycerophosphate glycerophosphotransferase [Paucilactobacillus suebicus]|uniref:CDP-glycerol poly(Glycerophosphate) glycerophosphotransferase n=1 Tax=Paucilactobacillus suebicus DSM 5007 = KCTC 3549 TaxID=1423807 RepID=A0A0R1W5X9_9LACO|nr:CDP-glycerol--glycerophosphate glycerophosphotransferase [Paucilactobacillus suebicus]KRM13272.1 CDP-glycerol poly(glycerophosphate) glycerophosphotransferase [Paucilactobacillus suebicus DSM 5007 = KCTC 3549]